MPWRRLLSYGRRSSAARDKVPAAWTWTWSSSCCRETAQNARRSHQEAARATRKLQQHFDPQLAVPVEQLNDPRHEPEKVSLSPGNSSRCDPHLRRVFWVFLVHQRPSSVRVPNSCAYVLWFGRRNVCHQSAKFLRDGTLFTLSSKAVSGRWHP